ncbi:exonuclease SbcCD subunit D [Ruminococcus sp. HUN007]|uniref:exonuclease SbcCD subunit D n=1 Tax=Ruminococcus sp. HUN007 TaxID=1514668 RepID=UPI000678BDE9|nr:exonuclease SbcCD subunit D [Ruminococcus sp. HUN007]
MRFLHIADLHFGKYMNEVALVKEDQPYWKNEFIKTVRETKADAVVIAGDVYDRSTPSSEAVALLDEFITELAEMNVPVLIAAGNHDSGQKLGFASSILSRNGVHISGVIPGNGIISHVTLRDEYGDVVFWLMPYIFPALVNDMLGTDFRDYDTACRELLKHQNIDTSVRNVMVAHQNVTRGGIEAERGGSETMVAGVGGIDYSAFEDFEYTALGHIHAAQQVGPPNIRYAGSPFCYHFDEAKYSEKGPVLVELGAKGGKASTEIIPIRPLHKVRVLEDTYKNIINELVSGKYKNEYLKAKITDCKVRPDLAKELRTAAEASGNRMLEITGIYELKRNEENLRDSIACMGGKSVTEHFADFYALMKDGAQPDEKELELIDHVSELLGIDDIDAAADRIIEYSVKQEGRNV